MNNNLDNKIKKELEENLKVPDIVKARMRESFEEVEKLEEKMLKQSKINFNKILTLVASFVMVIFLAGNGVAYAKGEPNIYSWVLEKIGMPSGYEEIKTVVNQISEYNGIKITLLDVGRDKTQLIVGYKIESEKGFSNDLGRKIDALCLGENYVLKKKDGTVIGRFTKGIYDSYVVGKISDNEYIVYSFSNIHDAYFEIEDDEFNLNINIDYIEGTGTRGEWLQDAMIEGMWNFYNVSTNLGNTDYKEYVIDIDKTINEEFKINSIRVVNAKMFSGLYIDKELNVDEEYYQIEQEKRYSIVVLDGEDVLVDSINDIGYGSDSGIFLKKMEENKTYTVQVHRVIINTINGEKIEDDILEEINIKFNNDDVIKQSSYIEKDLLLDEGVVIKEIKIEKSNNSNKVTIETSNCNGAHTEEISEISTGYKYMFRIYDKNNKLVKEIDWWYGKEIFVNEFELGEKYTIKIYKYIFYQSMRGNEIYIIDGYPEEKDLMLLSEYSFILK